MYDAIKPLLRSFVIKYADIRYEWGVVVAFLAFVFAMLFVKKHKKKTTLQMFWIDWVGIVVFSLYMVLVLGGTLLCRNVDEMYRVELRLFWSYWETFVKQNKGIWYQMLYNILVFIPWGILLPSLFKVEKKILIIGGATIFSFLIEFVQLIFKLGLFELDDVFHNMVGAIIGYGIWFFCQRVKSRRYQIGI